MHITLGIVQAGNKDGVQTEIPATILPFKIYYQGGVEMEQQVQQPSS